MKKTTTIRGRKYWKTVREIERDKRRQAKAEEAKGNLVFRDKTGKPVAVLDASNL